MNQLNPEISPTSVHIRICCGEVEEIITGDEADDKSFITTLTSLTPPAHLLEKSGVHFQQKSLLILSQEETNPRPTQPLAIVTILEDRIEADKTTEVEAAVDVVTLPVT